MTENGSNETQGLRAPILCNINALVYWNYIAQNAQLSFHNTCKIAEEKRKTMECKQQQQ